jgi:hypothetical protein
LIGHGFRLFQNTDPGEEAVRISYETAYCGRDFFDSVVSEPVKRRVSEGRQVLRRMSSKNGAAILIERCVAHIVKAILDRSPMASRQVKQRSSITSFGT